MTMVDKIDNTCFSLKDAIQKFLKNTEYSCVVEELYRTSRHNKFCSMKHDQRFYTAFKVAVKNHLENKVREDVLKALNNNFLQVLNIAWNDHESSISMIQDILIRVDKIYDKNIDYGTKFYNVYDLGLILFRDLIVRYGYIRDHLCKILLNLIKLERKGGVFDHIALKNSCQMLKDLGIYGRVFQKENFEVPYIEQSAEFYKLESQKCLDENSVYDFFRNFNSKVKEEVDHTKYFVLELGEFSIQKEIIKANMETIIELINYGISFMLKNNKNDYFSCFYFFLTPVDESRKTMFNIISQNLRELGKSLVQEGDCVNAVNYIQRLLDLKDNFDNILNYSFFNDKMFKQMFDADFEYLLNLNHKSPEYLAIFIDEKLKKGVQGLTENDIKLVLDKAVVISRYLQEKDVFKMYYKQHLVKRLLMNKSVINENEKSVINKLKIGCLFMSKLEGMFKDMSISTTIMDEFKEYAAKSKNRYLHAVDLNVKVLNTGIWPTHELSKCNIPLVPKNAFEEFRLFYLGKHNGRQLTLQPQLGSADLNAVFYGSRPSDTESLANVSTPNVTTANSHHQLTERQHIIQVSTYQMCVLLLFNTREKLTFDDIKNETDIPEKDLIRALQSLALGMPSQRILLKSPKCKEIDLNHEFSVNELFTSKLHRIEIQTFAAECKTEIERKENRCKVDEDPKHEIDAAIMRVMKFRKKINHNTLVLEVVEQLIIFLPSPSIIEKQIEGLIERKYLSRCPEDRQTYIYVE